MYSVFYDLLIRSIFLQHYSFAGRIVTAALSFPTAAISFTSFAETFHDPAQKRFCRAALPSTVRLCRFAVVFVVKSA